MWAHAPAAPRSGQPPPRAIRMLHGVTQFVLTVTCFCHQAHWTDEDTEAQSIFGTCARSHSWEGWSNSSRRPRPALRLLQLWEQSLRGAAGSCPRPDEQHGRQQAVGPRAVPAGRGQAGGCQAEGRVYPGLCFHHLPSWGLSFLIWKGNNRNQPQREFAADPGQQVSSWVCGPVSAELELPRGLR